MRVHYTKNFQKHFRTRITSHPNLDKRFHERLNLLLNNPQDSLLRNHHLAGAKKALSAVSVTGDIRLVFYIKSDTIFLVDIGSHNQVY